MAIKLTEPQKLTLRKIAGGGGTARKINFRSAEALRRYGLVERYTQHVIGADFADKNGVHPQHRATKAVHEWWITPAGRALLDEEKQP